MDYLGIEKWTWERRLLFIAAMSPLLPSGIPTLTRYRELLASDFFRQMEVEADEFLKEYGDALRGYADKWVLDPLHQWSRLWEYPYVCQRLNENFSGAEEAQVLDAGSGVTFFPYLIQNRLPKAVITTTDVDPEVEIAYQTINRKRGKAVQHVQSDMGALPFSDRFFDAVYCISVLEHVPERRKAIAELHRVLKPGGKLILTIDLSLDDTRDIGLEDADAMLSRLGELFEFSQTEKPLRFREVGSWRDKVTTTAIVREDISLLPWNRPTLRERLRSWIRQRRSLFWPPPLSFCCLELTKQARRAS